MTAVHSNFLKVPDLHRGLELRFRLSARPNHSKHTCVSPRHVLYSDSANGSRTHLTERIPQDDPFQHVIAAVHRHQLLTLRGVNAQCRIHSEPHASVVPIHSASSEYESCAVVFYVKPRWSVEFTSGVHR